MKRAIIIKKSETFGKIIDAVKVNGVLVSALVIGEEEATRELFSKTETDVIAVEDDTDASVLHNIFAASLSSVYKTGKMRLSLNGNIVSFRVFLMNGYCDIIENSEFNKTVDVTSFIKYLKDRISFSKEQSAMNGLYSFMAKVNMYQKFTGYNYFVEAFSLAYVDKSLLRSLTTKLYPMIAEKYGVSKAAVEKDIREMVNSSYLSGKLSSVMNEMYGGNMLKYEKPTVGELLSFLVGKLS